MVSTIRVRDMPKIRDELATKERWHRRDTDPLVSEWFLRGLEKAALWWVSEDMTTLVAKSFSEMPEWSPTIAAPEPEGIIVWSGDLPQLRKTFLSKSKVPLRAVYWHFTQRLCRITAFTDPTSTLNAQKLSEIDTFDFRADIPFNQSIVNAEFHHSRIVQILGASWLLMQQPTVAETRRVVPRLGRRKPPAGSPPSVNDIQIIELRKIATKRNEERGHDDGRDYHVRWLVRGHWRQQACGPGRKYRKPVFVPPHIRGPEGAPLKIDRVNVWRR